MDDAQKIAELRRKFSKNYIDPPTERSSKFDPRDVTRFTNDDMYALSFIHWKKEVIDDAVEMVADVLQWRKENGVTDLSVKSIGDNFFKKGICYVHGRDLAGLRVLVYIARLQTKEEKEISRKLFTFWLERLQRNEPGKHIIFILDTYKTSMSNVDLGLIRFIIDSFTSYFPDLLERIIILDMPWIMNAIWNIVKQWMSEEQRNKTVFCSRKDLHKYIALDQLPKDMAGKDDWTYSFPPFPDDLKQDQDFLKDPMNFSKDDLEEIDEACLVNGDVPSSEDTSPKPVHDDSNNNNAKEREKEESLHLEKQKEESLHVMTPTAGNIMKEDIPSTSGLNVRSRVGTENLVPNHFAENSMKKRSPKRRSSSPTKLKKTTSFDLGNTEKQAALINGEAPRNQLHTQSLDNVSSGKTRADISFQSVQASETSISKSEVKSAMNEIKLKDLLIMSPVSELTLQFDESDSSKSDRPLGFINIRNPNSPTSGENVVVAFKVKTTSPERYHVKPSVGVLHAGASTQIRVILNAGNTTTPAKDRFLLLYKQYPVEDDKSPSHGEVVRFWKQFNDKTAHHEQKLRVKYDGSPKSASEMKQDITRSTSLPVHSSATMNSFLNSDQSPDETELTQLLQQVSMLNRKITRLEGDTRWMRRRMRHTMGLLLVLIFLLVFILYEITVLSHFSQNSCVLLE